MKGKQRRMREKVNGSRETGENANGIAEIEEILTSPLLQLLHVQ